MSRQDLMEKTLVLLKPDAVQRGLIGEIITRFERVGLKIVAMKMIYADKDLANKHYAKDEEWMELSGGRTLKDLERMGKKKNITPVEMGRLIQQALAEMIGASPIVAMVLEGHNAVKHVRKMVGETAPALSAPGTIRGDYSFETYGMSGALNRPLQNLIHASGEVDEAEHEISIWFTPEEIHAWKRVDEDLLYSGRKDW